MRFTYQSLDPVPVSRPTVKHSRAQRTFQGIPSIGRSPGGRLFAVWYAGGSGEGEDNYTLLQISDDEGQSWSGPVAVVDPPHPLVRAFDSTLWLDPAGKMHWFWSQCCADPEAEGSCRIYDGLGGVWHSILENPEAAPAEFQFSWPERIAHGIMMNKPLVLRDGTWCLPVSLWTGQQYRRHPSLAIQPGASMVVSEDQGRSFSTRGRIEMSQVKGGASFDEHLFLERQDGTLQVLLRVQQGVAEAFSNNQGRTWTAPVLATAITGPSSRFFCQRLPSGRLLLIYHDLHASNRQRERLTAYLSEDEGLSWPWSLLLDERSAVSYPDAVFTADGQIYVIYDHERYRGGEIFLARFREEEIIAGRLLSAGSALRQEVDHSRPVPEK